MSSQDHRETLDSLLDSLSEDQEIEKKMDDFARNKERAERIARARQTSRQFQQTYSSSARRAAKDQYPRTIQPEPDEEGDILYNPDAAEDTPEPDVIMAPAYSRYENSPASTQSAGGMTREFPGRAGNGDLSAGGGTRVFTSSPAQSGAEEDGLNQTREVRVGSDEIASLLDQDEPILRREYIRDDEDEYDDGYDDSHLFDQKPSPRRRSSSSKEPVNWRVIAIVAGIAMAIVLIGGAGYMIYHYMSSQQVEQDSEGFNTVMDWVAKYPEYSDEEKKKILSLKRIYDRLSEDEKRKVNEQLLALTGKTFDELLAEASSQQKPSSANSDVANAERKAQLREQIDQLTGEINSLNSQLDAANRRIDEAKRDYDSKNDAAAQAEADRDSLQAEVDSLNGSIAQTQQTIDSLTQQINDARNQQPSRPSRPDHGDDDDSQASSSVPAVDTSGLEKQLEEAKRQLSDYQSQLGSAQTRLDQAKNDAAAARSEADSAYGAWQEVANDATQIQNDINQKMTELSSLQDEYNSIK